MSNARVQLASIWQLLEGDKRGYGRALVALLVGALLLYMIPLVPQAVLDVALSKDPETGSYLSKLLIDALGGTVFVRTHLWIAAIAIATIAIASAVAVHLRQRFAATAAQNTGRRLRRKLYDHVQRLPCETLDELEPGDLLQRSTSDVDTIVLFLSEQIVMLGRAVAMLIVPLPIMLLIDWRMTLVSGTLLLPIAVFSYVFFTQMRERFLKKDQAEGRLTATVNENLVGIRVVRAFARQAWERERFAERNDEYRILDNRLYILMARFWSISDLMCFAQQCLVIGFGLWWLTQGTLEIGSFYFFVAAATMFLWPLRMSGRILAELGKALVAMGRIREILDRPIETDPEHPLELTTHDGAIRFDDVHFAHGDLPVLCGLSMSIAAGETVALVGPSGSGKTTIVDLLLRLHDPDSGAITLDGLAINQLRRHDLRSRTAVVMQQPFLFSRSIRANIAITLPDHAHDSIESAARDACIHDSIHRFDKGYETVVGERGLTLSGGQRQRVAIARALVQRPDVLVLDDALSAVDTATERSILQAIRNRHGKQTTLLIAHRISTLREADRIVVLEAGRVSQCGTHEELITQGGFYARLHAIQSRSAEEGGAA